MKKKWRVILAVVLFIVIAGVVMLVQTLRYGFSAHDEPAAIEAFAVRTVRSWAVPADLRNEKNPVPVTPAVLAEARAHWADHCATCHANDGKGSEMGKSMYPRAPDMTSPRVQKLPDGELFASIENGIRMTGMPGFGKGNAGSASGSWGLVHFVRHLPKITPEELTEMQKLNPKSPDEWQQMQDEEAFFAEGGDASPTPAPAAPQKTHH